MIPRYKAYFNLHQCIGYLGKDTKVDFYHSTTPSEVSGYQDILEMIPKKNNYSVISGYQDIFKRIPTDVSCSGQ